LALLLVQAERWVPEVGIVHFLLFLQSADPGVVNSMFPQPVVPEVVAEQALVEELGQVVPELLDKETPVGEAQEILHLQPEAAVAVPEQLVVVLGMELVLASAAETEATVYQIA
jgi:hypothetical protein